MDFRKIRLAILLLMFCIPVLYAFFLSSESSSYIVIHEYEYVGGVAGVEYQERNTIHGIIPEVGNVIYRSSSDDSVNIKVHAITDDRLVLELSDGIFYNGERTNLVTLTKDEQIRLVLSENTIGLCLLIEWVASENA